MPNRVSILQTCSLAYCSEGIVALGYCQYHYSQQRRGKAFTPRSVKSPPSSCIGPDCKRLAVAKRMCASHWAQAKRGHELSPLKTQPYTPLESFEKNIKRMSYGCWNWQLAGAGKGYRAADKQGGYGQLRVSGQVFQAHRWAYEYFKRIKLHPEDTLDHTCRNTKCCNPEHLEIVSRRENTKRSHLYHQLRSENARLLAFLERLGENPTEVLWPSKKE